MKVSGRFADRSAAGKRLANRLVSRVLEKPVVLAMPRGGVPVAVEIARALKAPLDLVLVRKIGVPFQLVGTAKGVDGVGDLATDFSLSQLSR
jgi:putative phosphoribosyl transferase